jgi:hypothetical protein
MLQAAPQALDEDKVVRPDGSGSDAKATENHLVGIDRRDGNTQDVEGQLVRGFEPSGRHQCDPGRRHTFGEPAREFEANQRSRYLSTG